MEESLQYLVASAPGRSPHLFHYDEVDQPVSYLSPLVTGLTSTETVYAYTLDKELKSITRPGGDRVTLNYHPATGQLLSEVLPSGTVDYSYHPITGQLYQLSGPYGESLSFEYDGFLVSKMISNGEVIGAVEAEYDNNFRLSKLHVNGASSTIAYTYDPDSLPLQVGELIFSNDPENGSLNELTISDGGNTVSESFTYNEFGERETVTARINSDSPLFAVTYTRDKLGRIGEKSETILGTTATFNYTYDEAGRLRRVNKNGAIISTYDYDSNSNRTGINGTTCSVDAQDRLLTFGANSYSYTANGELLTKTTPAGTTQYTYDIYGSLLQVTLPGGTAIDYVIDPLGRRVGKKVNGTVTQRFIYQSELRVAAELDAVGNVITRFVYGTKANVPDYFVRNGETYRILTDHLGSPRFVVDLTNGTVIWKLNHSLNVTSLFLIGRNRKFSTCNLIGLRFLILLLTIF